MIGQERLFDVPGLIVPPGVEARTCIRCGETKPVDEFASRANADGRVGYRKHCRDCYRESLRVVRSVDRAAFIAAHGGRCEACASTHRLTIDHDHRTDRLRGLLCDRCNLVLGHALEDFDRFLGLVAYCHRNGIGRAA